MRLTVLSTNRFLEPETKQEFRMTFVIPPRKGDVIVVPNKNIRSACGEVYVDYVQHSEDGPVVVCTNGLM